MLRRNFFKKVEEKVLLPCQKGPLNRMLIGDCISSLVQGIHYYKDKDGRQAIDLMHWDIGGYEPSDIEVVAAFDIDKRKAGGFFGFFMTLCLPL